MLLRLPEFEQEMRMINAEAARLEIERRRREQNWQFVMEDLQAQLGN